jgi:hypothetical protein
MDGWRFAFVPSDPVLLTVVDVETVIPVVEVLVVLVWSVFSPLVFIPDVLEGVSNLE